MLASVADVYVSGTFKSTAIVARAGTSAPLEKVKLLFFCGCINKISPSLVKLNKIKLRYQPVLC